MHLLTQWCHLLIMCVAAGVDVMASPEGSEAVSQLQEPTHPRFRSGLWAGSSHQCPCESRIGWYLPVPERHFSATRYAYRIFNEIGSLGERTYEKWCGPALPPSLQKQEVLLFSGQTLVVHWSGFSPWLSLQEYPGKGLVKPSRAPRAQPCGVRTCDPDRSDGIPGSSPVDIDRQKLLPLGISRTWGIDFRRDAMTAWSLCIMIVAS